MATTEIPTPIDYAPKAGLRNRSGALVTEFSRTDRRLGYRLPKLGTKDNKADHTRRRTINLKNRKGGAVKESTSRY